MKASVLSPNFRYFFVFFLFLSIVYSSTAQETPWKLKRDKKGLKVYFRKSKNSKVNELKLVTEIEGSLNAVVALFKDIPSYPQWVYKCIVAEKKETSEQSGVFYNEIDFPWPLTNRDFYARSKISQDPDTKVVTSTLKGLPNYGPEKENAIRLQLLDVKWQFTPIAPEKIKLEYYLKSDPGGSIPAWLINMALDQGPKQTVAGIQKMMYLPKYKNATFAFIQEGDERAFQLNSKRLAKRGN